VGIAAYAFFAGRPTPVLPGFLAWLEHYPQHLLNIIPVALLVWFLWRAIHAGEDEQPPVGGPAAQDMSRPA